MRRDAFDSPTVQGSSASITMLREVVEKWACDGGIEFEGHGRRLGACSVSDQKCDAVTRKIHTHAMPPHIYLDQLPATSGTPVRTSSCK